MKVQLTISDETSVDSEKKLHRIFKTYGSGHFHTLRYFKAAMKYHRTKDILLGFGLEFCPKPAPQMSVTMKESRLPVKNLRS